ncbi:cell division protein FtsK [Liquorilactobacillus aquaticus DSM 21051]|uniref:DNA translocase FtsK n=2 Tax=Liquorilactobacillus aquaticus TaxID=392566 RepID=A0A0R2D7W4_9LACO|nr:cell division protein FtsK [Liquorilactobacillus aquaticus DSM 21051]
MQKAEGKDKKHIERSMQEQIHKNRNKEQHKTKINQFKQDRKVSGHAFRPTYVPPPILKLQKFASEQAKYDHLFVQLKKERESFLLFGGEGEYHKNNVIILEDENTAQKVIPEPEQHVEVEAKSVTNADMNQAVFGNVADESETEEQDEKLLKKKDSLVENKEAKILNNSQNEQSIAEHVDISIDKSDKKTVSTNNNNNFFLPTVGKNEVNDTDVEEKGIERELVLAQTVTDVKIDNDEKKIGPQSDKIIVPKKNELYEGNENETEEKTLLKSDREMEGCPAQSVNEEYQYPPVSLLPAPIKNEDESMDEWVLSQIDVLNETLKSFNVKASVKDWTIGPAVTQFEIVLGRGVKVNKITNLSDDLKLALAAQDIRIEAPIPGKSSVGVEIPNLHSRPVMLSEVLTSDLFVKKTSPLTVALGVDLFGRPKVTDLRKMPHGLIAGATGSGKSVFINSILVSLLYKATPAQVKLLLIDPKAVELAPYHEIPHLLSPVISDPAAAAAALKWAVEEMEERYQRLAAGGARNIEGYNSKAEKHGDYGLKMPYIVIIIDELADLMMAASSEVQDYIARITQKARAAGIHLIIATQRPSVDVITGTIKNNIPTRIAFMVSSQVDSRTILDCSGAERLLGRGDMLYLGNGESQPTRIQGTFVENEVDQISDFVRTQGSPKYAFDPASLKKKIERNDQEDELLPRVLDYIVNEENISTSKLQRVFSIGYNRAANIIDDLEQKQYISPARGSKPRDVFLTQAGLDKLKD